MRIEHWWYVLPLRLKSLFRRGQVERELDEELRFHLEQKIEEGVARGLSPEAARNEALQAFGGVDQKKEEVRDMRGVHGLTDFLDDVRYAFRSLRRASGLSLFVIMALALGIGMSAAAFSMVDALIFRPYPVRDPGRVVNLVGTSPDNTFDPWSYREYLDLQRGVKSYDGVVAHGPTRVVGWSARAGDTPRVQAVSLVSGNFWSVMGIAPEVGRLFRPSDDEVPGRDAVAVVAYDFWQTHLAGDPAVIGQTHRLNGMPFTIIGVAPESFPGMNIFIRPDFYVPIAMERTFALNPQKDFFEDRDARELLVKGRLKPGVSLEQARSEIQAIASTFEKDHAETNRNRSASVRTQFQMRTSADDLNWKFGVIFNVLALSVLFIACTNVAGLLLSRARARTREIAIRLAIGAGRYRVVRLLLTETLVLSLLGGLGGVIVAFGVVAFFHQFSIPADLPIEIPFRIDGRALTACLGFSLVAAFLCGLAPALQSTRADLVHGLKSGEGEEPGRRRLWGRNVLVVAQVSTSLMLITAALLMARSFRESVLATTGFSRDHLLMARFDPRLVQYDDARTKRFYEELSARARMLPGVQSTALTTNPPLGLDPFARIDFVPDGYEMPAGREHLTSTMDTVDESFFTTMGITIVEGRAFRAADNDSAPRVAVVNEHFAKHYWPGGSAVGRRIWLDRRGGTPVEIVGVARTIKYRETTENPPDFLYLPLAQHPVTRMVMMLRTTVDPLLLTGPLKDLVRSMDANLPISELRTYEDLYRYSAIEGPGVAIRLVGSMGAMALFLAIAGLYGLVAYNVSRRTREIGIRMAIGATPADILKLVVGKGLVLVGVGTAIGLAMGFAVERLMKSMVFRASGIDFVAYAIVVPAMFAVTLLAAYLPARRAARIDPTVALRCE